MKSKFFTMFAFLTLAALSAGCAGTKPTELAQEFTSHTFPAGQYTPKVDNFLFILDTSSSMGKDDGQNIKTAKNVIGAINQSLPPDLTFNAGLRSFGHNFKQSWNLTDQVYGMTHYTRSGLQEGLSNVNYVGGTSPLPEALEAAGKDLQGMRGKSAIIIVSDGLVKSEMSGAPATLAKLKADMGSHLCTYTIAVGSAPAGEKFLHEIAKADGCGFSETAASLAAPGQLESFVNKVFLDRKAVAVAAAVPILVAEPRDGDADADGVLDSRDRCPDTPQGEIVDEYGCTLKLTLHINFDFDKSDIRPEFAPDLKKAGDFILKNKDVPYILIAGFTDSTGREAYNQGLSERRAGAIREYLIDNFDIDPNRLVARGNGESNPATDNSSEAGRAQNRRVEVICCAIILPAI